MKREEFNSMLREILVGSEPQEKQSITLNDFIEQIGNQGLDLSSFFIGETHEPEEETEEPETENSVVSKVRKHIKLILDKVELSNNDVDNLLKLDAFLKNNEH